MPMMFGFGVQRKQMLEAELERLVDEMPRLGMTQMYLVGDFAKGKVGPDTMLNLLVVQETDVAKHRRADFWTTHLRPRVGTEFFVFTSGEFDSTNESDPMLREAAAFGDRIYG
ncbi:MAG: hypothetical protein ACPHK0_07540 [Dehalococcoidia bacterium]